MLPPILDSAYTVHVSKLGSDSNSGFAGQYPVNLANDAKLTIGAAVSAAPDGGTILIWPGDYAESVDILTAAKQLNVLGTHREKCRITPSSGHAVAGYEGLLLANLSIYSTLSGIGNQPVNCDSQNNCRFIDLNVDGINCGDSIYCPGGANTLVKGCYILGLGDNVSVGENSRIEDCIIIATGRTTYSSIRGVWVAISTIGVTNYDLTILRSRIICQPSWGIRSGMLPVVYESETNLEGVATAGRLIMRDTTVIADGSKPSGAHADSYSKGNASAIYGCSALLAENCNFVAKTDLNWDYTASAIKNCNNPGVQLANCNIESSGTLASYDIYGSPAAVANLVNCNVDPAKIYSVHLRETGSYRAAKMLLNKAVQNKFTGAIQYFDDDGVTPILTHTPSEDESSLTRTVS